MRGLTVYDAIAVIIGTMIGNGVFLKSATIAQYVGSPGMVLLVWIVAGLLSLCGALAYAELGALMPEAGGEYVYLKEGFGRGLAFVYGWMRFWIASPGSFAASAVVSATFLGRIIELGPWGGETAVAVYILVFFSALNCLSVATSGKIQSLMTLVKILLITGIVVGIYGFSKESSWTHLTHASSTPLSFTAFCAAILSSLWAYDGWCNLASLAGEVSEPQKNIPRSFIIGMLMVMGIYLTINLAYFYALPFSEVLTANSDLYPGAAPLAMKAVWGFLGTAATGLLTIGFVISSMGALNGGIMASSRVPFAMARDGLFFEALARVGKRSHAPVNAVLVQGAVSIALALSGTFEQLTNYVVFAVWIFYALVTSVVFIMRVKRPDAVRSYRTLGYPVLPGLFIVLAIVLLGMTAYTSPKFTGIGLAFILSGIPAYYWFEKQQK